MLLQLARSTLPSLGFGPEILVTCTIFSNNKFISIYNLKHNKLNSSPLSTEEMCTVCVFIINISS